MEVFETILNGTDEQIDGLVTTTTEAGAANHYTFSSIDGSLKLTIAKDEDGNWKRLSSTEPYLSGWVEELGGKIDAYTSPTF